MRIVFMGTPEFAVPSLNALLDNGYDVVGVITQPDRPVGRGHKVAMTPVKQAAVARNVPVYQFERLRKQEGLDCLRALKPALCVTAAFGQILSRKLLEVPRLGTINVHASLLPKYRGSAPINWCIANGEKVTGEGLLARALCHEIDHLDGIVYVDKMIEEIFDDEDDEEDEEE